MRFGKCFFDEYDHPLLAMVPYVVAPDQATFKLGAAAMFAAPFDPSEGDLAAIKNLGYDLTELATKIKVHNDSGRQPFIPEPLWALNG